EAGDMPWCRQVSGSSFVTGSWHQTEADLAPNPVGRLLLFCLVQEERAGSFSCFVVSPPPGHGSFVANFAQRLFEKSSIGGISSVHSGDERQSIPHRPH